LYFSEGGKAKEKVHACKHCSKSFYKLNHLEQHTRVHTGEKPFSCTMCPKTFHTSQGLKKHLIILDVKNEDGTKAMTCRLIYSSIIYILIIGLVQQIVAHSIDR
jgi:uncharacterized Zn-finger protein